MKSGVLNLYKEKDFTSHDAVARIRRLFGTKKVGHTGTLDPQATGVLPILIGNAVKACDLIPNETKTYLATVRFGILTDTEDIWGKVLEEDPARPDEEAFRQSILNFQGEYDQIPPMISAVKINGKKLYEYAREGKTVERKPRPVTIHSLELVSFSSEEAILRARVSKGTYIRTLLVDLCRSVGVLGAMSALVREQSGPFSLAGAVTLSQLEEMTLEEREALLLPTEQIFESYPVFQLPPFFDGLIANGLAVRAEKLKCSAPAGTLFRLYRNGTFFALGETVLTQDGVSLRAKKQFPTESEG